MSQQDELITDLIIDLAACLCAEVAADKEKHPDTLDLCYCGPVLGANYLDMVGVGPCGEMSGQAWVRLAGVYPSTNVGQADMTPGNCVKTLGYDIEVGILRFMGMEDNGEPWPAEEVLRAALLQIRDVGIIQRTFNCCDSLANKSYVMGQYTPIGPEGFLVGGSWTISVTPLP